MFEMHSCISGYDKVPVLNSVNLFVGARHFTGILGRNGMGKTTLLRSAIGELAVWSGQIKLNGIDITKYESHERAAVGIGYVPQGRHIFPMLTVEENLKMGCVKDFSKTSMMIEKMLHFFPRLKRLLNQPGGALSGGEQQLLSLARCLCGEPQLVLLDEPTEGIQPNICDEIVELLLKIKDIMDLSVIIVEQDIEFLCELSDEIHILEKGRITETIKPNDYSIEGMAERFMGVYK